MLEAACIDNVPALQSALDNGGSTEEADEVRWFEKGLGPTPPTATPVPAPTVTLVPAPHPPTHSHTSSAHHTPSTRPLLQYGRSALHWAAHYGHLEALRTLLAAGADPARADKVRE